MTLAREAEESPLKPLLGNGSWKQSRLEKGPACAVVICKVWRLALVL
jgi:hypothetical protein